MEVNTAVDAEGRGTAAVTPIPNPSPIEGEGSGTAPTKTPSVFRRTRFRSALKAPRACPPDRLSFLGWSAFGGETAYTFA